MKFTKAMQKHKLSHLVPLPLPPPKPSPPLFQNQFSLPISGRKKDGDRHHASHRRRFPALCLEIEVPYRVFG